jgi:TIR domain
VTTSLQFDVFLSHNGKDKPMVRAIGEALKARNISVWLDEWQLVPGQPWQQALENIIETTKAAAVLVGNDGLGPWEQPEVRACLSEYVERNLPVIPVLLPGAPQMPKLPIFLRAFTWVDLREGLTDSGIDNLVWGITGQRPAAPGMQDAPTPIFQPGGQLRAASMIRQDKPLDREAIMAKPLYRDVKPLDWEAIEAKPLYRAVTPLDRPYLPAARTERSAAEYFPRARQLPVIGLLFSATAQVWCLLRDNWKFLVPFLDYETIKQMIVFFVLLVSGLYPIMVLRAILGTPYGHGYTWRTRAWFFLWGLALVSIGGVTAQKYRSTIASTKSARAVLERMAAEHQSEFQRLSAAWQSIPDMEKAEFDTALSRVENKIAPNIRPELGENVSLFVAAKVTESDYENRLIWMGLSIFAILSGIVNVVCGWIWEDVAALKYSGYG